MGLLTLLAACAAAGADFQPADLLKLRSAGTVQFSPDGSRLAYTIVRNDVPGRPLTQLWVMTLADGKSACLSTGNDASSEPEWSPDGTRIAYSGTARTNESHRGAHADGSGKRFIAPLEGT